MTIIKGTPEFQARATAALNELMKIDFAFFVGALVKEIRQGVVADDPSIVGGAWPIEEGVMTFPDLPADPKEGAAWIAHEMAHIFTFVMNPRLRYYGKLGEIRADIVEAMVRFAKQGWGYAWHRMRFCQAIPETEPLKGNPPAYGEELR